MSGENEPFWLCPTQLFDGERIRSGLALLVSRGMIEDIQPVEQARRHPAPLREMSGLLVPGYFDIQVNGGGGVAFNTSPTIEGLAAIAAAHRPLGTTALFPTLMTDSADAMQRAADAMIAFGLRDGIAGMHIEGPHISLERRGAHDARHIRPIETTTLDVVERLGRNGIPVLITLAPEVTGIAPIENLRRAGAVVSLGHTAATPDIVKKALAAGASMFTHLYNGMTPMASRAPGVVGTAIDSDAYCSFICDGHHVDDTMLRIAFHARPIDDRMVLISDAMPTVGGPDHYELYGERIRLVSGRLINAAGSLAGAHTSKAQGVQRLLNILQVDLATSLRMATSNPARLMNLEDRLGHIAPGHAANLVLLDDNFAPQMIWERGKHGTPSSV